MYNVLSVTSRGQDAGIRALAAQLGELRETRDDGLIQMVSDLADVIEDMNARLLELEGYEIDPTAGAAPIGAVVEDLTEEMVAAMENAEEVGT